MLSADKKAVSEVIGYILLISIAVAMSVIVYAFLKSYVPTEKVECPDDVSVLVENYSYNCESENLIINLKNNGKFNITGAYIRGSDSEDKIATTNLESENHMFGNIVLLGEGSSASENSFGQGDIAERKFKADGNLVYIEIIPVRNQDYNNKIKQVSCTNSVIKQNLVCED